MRNFLILVFSSFVMAAIMSAAFTKQSAEPLTPECYTSCFISDVREYSKMEARTMDFAMLHDEPLPFELEDKKGKMIDFKTPDGNKAMAYEIKGKKKSKNYLLVIQEWWGLNDYIKQESDKLAGDLDDVTILALDMYDGKVATTRDSAMKYMSGVNNERLENIIKGAIAYAGKDAKIFTIGWCFGGMWSLQAGIIAGNQGAGTIMYYGRPETNLEKLQKLQTDVIGFFGNKDRSPSPEMVDAFIENMKKVDKKLTVHRYDAGHGFANPSNPNFDKEATKDSYEKTLAFIKARL
ncbi:dienelactone hydrolase family protein [Aridibaculum aurantiacum]|uniref:dienelactone hydrolase family protein n=1 Tax=Aridibaculum aurantiacum TaxID=2810307 RepID=UPI001A95C8D7|nr:dienelactone hydrolase family protein [Aridibaculum aurantiacum]